MKAQLAVQFSSFQFGFVAVYTPLIHHLYQRRLCTEK